MRLRAQLAVRQQQDKIPVSNGQASDTYLCRCFWQVGNVSGTWPEMELTSGDVPAAMRRRLTSLGRRAIAMLYASVASLDNKDITWVLASRHGDTDRMANLLTGLSQKELLSPTDFSMSVHNAIIGMFSIATGNTQMQTSLSGGALSFETGLLEALALQKDKNSTVGYIYYDAPLTPHYNSIFKNNESEICTIIILEDNKQQADFKGESRTFKIDFIRDSAAFFEGQAGGAISFLNFIQSNENSFSLHVPGGAIHVEQI